MKIIQYIGYILMIIAYTVLLIEYLGFKTGFFITIFTISILIVIFMMFRCISPDKIEKELGNQESISQSIGNGIEAKGDITFKNINQYADVDLGRRGKE